MTKQTKRLSPKQRRIAALLRAVGLVPCAWVPVVAQ